VSSPKRRAPAPGVQGADPWNVALAAIRAEREEALTTLATIEQAIIRARTLPRNEAVKVLDAAGSLEHELGLAERDAACDVLLEEAFPDIAGQGDAPIPLDEAERIVRASLAPGVAS
jgi:hypothetical protein